MKAGHILLLGRDPSPLEPIHKAVEDSGLEVVHATDWFSALQVATDAPPEVVLIAPDIAEQDVCLFLERAKSNPALRNLPLVLLVETASRETILKFITIGIRSYILIPCPASTLRRRLACHLPALSDKKSASPQSAEKSVGARLRQRMERNLRQNLQNKLHDPAPAPSFPSIPIVEQIFSQSFGLTIRENERQVSLCEKIDELRLRLGGDSSHLVGVLIQLLSAGKVRIGFRDKTERLSLADSNSIMTRDMAIELIDAYLANSSQDLDSEPSTQTCRLIVR